MRRRKYLEYISQWLTKPESKFRVLLFPVFIVCIHRRSSDKYRQSFLPNYLFMFRMFQSIFEYNVQLEEFYFLFKTLTLEVRFVSVRNFMSSFLIITLHTNSFCMSLNRGRRGGVIIVKTQLAKDSENISLLFSKTSSVLFRGRLLVHQKCSLISPLYMEVWAENIWL